MWPFKQKKRAPAYNVLVDSDSQALLALHTNVAVIVFLLEAVPGSTVVYGANYHHPKETFQPAQATTSRYPEWTWQVNERRFVRTKADMLTETLWQRSQLAVEKGEAILSIMNGISVARYPISSGVLFQESVYIEKKEQAEGFKDAGYSEDDLLAYPYVIQYADLEQIALKDAADDIIFKAKLDGELLAKTELLRLKYFNAIKHATAVEELPAIRELFLREGFWNAFS